MKLELKVFSLKKGSRYLQSLKNSYEKIEKPKHSFRNEFIVVGENDGNYKAQQLHEKGISVFADIDIAFISLEVPKEEFEWDGSTFVELDIPKKNLTLDIIDDIKRLNEDA